MCNQDWMIFDDAQRFPVMLFSQNGQKYEYIIFVSNLEFEFIIFSLTIIQSICLRIWNKYLFHFLLNIPSQLSQSPFAAIFTHAMHVICLSNS